MLRQVVHDWNAVVLHRCHQGRVAVDIWQIRVCSRVNQHNGGCQLILGTSPMKRRLIAVVLRVVHQSLDI